MSSWGNLRVAVWERQSGICAYCGQFVSVNNMVLHHVQNRHDGGPNIIENAEGRHITCEREAHALYRHGNREEGRNDNRERKRDTRLRKRHRRLRLPKLWRKAGGYPPEDRQEEFPPDEMFKLPGCYFRPVNKARKGKEKQLVP